MPSFTSALAAFSLAASAMGHMSPFMRSMYGVGWKATGADYDFQSLDAGDPFTPLGPEWQQNDWWFRGPANRALPPAPGAVSLLPAGGSITMEIACHYAWTSFGYATTTPGSLLDACPGNSGAYHSGDPSDNFITDSMLSGCALGIADVDDISKVTMDNLAIFSVQQECVKQKYTSFDIPARMPACTGSKCICGWFWLANNGTGNFYMTAFDCDVTGSPIDATPISKPVDPTWCDRDALAAGTCTTVPGAKRPLYSYNYPYNIEWKGNWDRPGYHDNWSFKQGAQNDIFEPKASLPISVSVSVALPTPSIDTLSIASASSASVASASSASAASVASRSSASVASASSASVVSASSASVASASAASVASVASASAASASSASVASRSSAAIASASSASAASAAAASSASVASVSSASVASRSAASVASASAAAASASAASVASRSAASVASASASASAASASSFAAQASRSLAAEASSSSAASVSRASASAASAYSAASASMASASAAAAAAAASTSLVVTKAPRESRKVYNGRPAATSAFGPAATSVPVAGPSDLARAATVTVSSEQASINQGAKNVNDGNPASEWSTYQEKAGAWVKLTWPSPVTFNQIVMFDRASMMENVVGGLVTLADGSTIVTSQLNNNGSATYFNISSVTTTSLTFKVTLVARTTQNVGLADIQLYNVDPSSLKNLLKVNAPGASLWLPWIPPTNPKSTRSLKSDDHETRSIKERLALIARSISAPKQRHARDFQSIGDDFGAEQIMVEEPIQSRCSGLDHGCEVTAEKLFDEEA